MGAFQFRASEMIIPYFYTGGKSCGMNGMRISYSWTHSVPCSTRAGEFETFVSWWTTQFRSVPRVW